MPKEPTLLDRIYFDLVFTAVARAIGYRGLPYCKLWPVIEELAKKFDKVKVEQAIYHLCTFEGQNRCNPPPLAQVAFRPEVRPLMFMLLGPAPEDEDKFWRHPNGEPMERPKKAESFAEQVSEPEPEKKKRRGKGR